MIDIIMKVLEGNKSECFGVNLGKIFLEVETKEEKFIF